MPCLPCDMTQTDARQGLQTNGSDVRTRAPPERTVKTPSRSFWHIGWKQPHMTNVSTKPKDTAKWVPNTNIPAFLVQHLDRAHAAKPIAHTQRHGNSFASTIPFIHITHHPSEENHHA